MKKRCEKVGWLQRASPWLLGTIVLLFVFVLVCFIVIRRDVIDYRMPHRFAVSDSSFFSSAHALADPRLVGGNRIDLLHNGQGFFPAMLTAIRQAQSSINFEAFLFHSSQVGNQFIDALCERAQAGVRVRVLLDGMGSGNQLDNTDVARLENAGCAFAYFHPTKSWRLDRANLRTHRRILVVDGRIGFTGGAGFSDEWLGNADTPEHWRDVHARLEGPLVAKLQAAFQQHWFVAKGEALGGEADFPELKPVGSLRGQVVDSAAYTVAPLSLVQAVAFASATKRIYITNAYCAPSESQTEALIKAVQRGVDVRLLLPGPHNDQPLTKAAGRHAYGRLLRGGVKIYEYQPTMIHSKTMVVDGLFSVFGSSNFDARSIEINEELDVTVYDEKFGQEMEKVFYQDLAQSKPYTLADFKKRSWKERISEWLVLPFRSQM
jgi:cardiolipin synthase A/B